jgi:hypothetical protein
VRIRRGNLIRGLKLLIVERRFDVALWVRPPGAKLRNALEKFKTQIIAVAFMIEPEN